MENNEDNKSIIESFTIIPETEKYGGWEESIYFKKNEDDNSLQVYSKDNILIATVDNTGKVVFQEEYLEKLRELFEEKMNIASYEDLVPDNKNREIYIDDLLKINQEKIQSENGNELSKKQAQVENVGNSIPKKEVEENVAGKNYTNRIMIKETDPIYEDFPDLEKPLFISYNESGDFVATTIDNEGNQKESEVIKSARSTMKPVTHIDDKGREVTEMVPSGIMDTRKDNLKVSVKIGQYGYTEAQKIQITHDNKWIATDIDKEENHDKLYPVKYATDLTKHGECGNEELADNYEMQKEELEDDKITLREIDHNSKETMEKIKRDVIDSALENYEEMSREELYDFIVSELSYRLEDEDLELAQIASEIRDTVNEEARFPTKDERKA